MNNIKEEPQIKIERKTATPLASPKGLSLQKTLNFKVDFTQEPIIKSNHNYSLT